MTDLKTNEIKFINSLVKISLKYLLNYFPPYLKGLCTNVSYLFNSLP